MTIAATITVLFWVSLVTLLWGLVRRALLWSHGRAASAPLSGVIAVPKRYFGDLHDIVSRDTYLARAHIATAGGAAAIFVLVALNYGFMLDWLILDWAILAACAVMLNGVYFIWARRRRPPSRLSGGAWNRLPYALAGFAGGLGLLLLLSPGTLSSLIALAALLALLAGSMELALGIGTGGPMKHAVAGLAHLAFHPRPERFKGDRSTALKPLALDKLDFGIASPSDFQWNQLIGFDACVQCGKCEAACPAFAAGQPLNPKKLIQDLVCGIAGTTDADYAGSPHPGRTIGEHSGAIDAEIVPSLIEPETIWSCTTCRACVEECPMLIEHVDAIIGLRRHRNLARGDAPNKAAETLANLRETGTQGGFAPSQRFAFAADLGLEHRFSKSNRRRAAHRRRRRLRHALSAHAACADHHSESCQGRFRRSGR